MTVSTRDFLLEFKQHRKMKPLLQRLKKDPQLRTEIFAEIEKDEYPFSEYASWIAQHFFEHTRSDFAEWMDAFIDILETTRNHTVQRNLVHIFTRVRCNVSENGRLLDIFFALLDDPGSLPALKVNSFKAIEKQYLKAYPELLSELKHRADLMGRDERPSLLAMNRNFMKKHRKELLKMDL
jgi:hypothetical protein